MRITLSQAIEDYLKAIYDLTVCGERATTNLLAERMGVAPASVTGMIKRLAAATPPLVSYQKHHGVTLTPEGDRIALEVIRHHRLIELFLHETLGYSWDEVHAEADRLEHVISEEMEERIAQSLGNPSRDPHGEPIPDRDLLLPPSSSLRLSELRPGQRARVERVEAADLKFLRYLDSICLTPGVEINILEYSVFDENLRLQVSGVEQPVVLGPRVTSRVYVVVLG
jgi:DtxR family transcriptional regulator, Mn-dependent transcriptional regulator